MTKTETNSLLPFYKTDPRTVGQVIGRGYRSQCEEWAAEWNANPELFDDCGPATVRYRPGLGWHVTVTAWAGSEAYRPVPSRPAVRYWAGEHLGYVSVPEDDE